ncbi:tyrosine-type recombinase/integrase [Gryllotalpicola reticulitermitis]|uniref:Tyrosine-type recombinase/integrase n=1 Tax=Gryllotalpicola reticulitermitis TaxID=1184153 RepID=A0ABV8Q5J2_9MICO
MTIERLAATSLTPWIARPELHAARIADALDSALAPSTRAAYRGALDRLARWARRERFVEPMSPACLAAYVTELAETGRSASAIGQVLAAVAREAFETGAPDPTQDPVLRQVVEGSRRRVAEHHVVRRAHPMTTPELARILAAIDQETVVGRRDAAITALLYAGAFRRSEVAAFNRSEFTVGADGIRILVRRSKRDQLAVGETVGIARGKHAATDPVRLVTRWLAGRGKVGPTEPVFVKVTRTGALCSSHMTGHAIGEIIKSRAKAAGLDAPITGHSGRRGHVSTAILAGSDLAVVAKTTRHKSLSSLMLYADELRVMERTTSADLGL